MSDYVLPTEGYTLPEALLFQNWPYQLLEAKLFKLIQVTKMLQVQSLAHLSFLLPFAQILCTQKTPNKPCSNLLQALVLV